MDFKDKPGAALESLIPKWAAKQAEGCGCKNYARKMDKAGVERCIIRKHRIIGHLIEQRRYLPWWLRWLPMWVMRRGASWLVERAIKLAS